MKQCCPLLSPLTLLLLVVLALLLVHLSLSSWRSFPFSPSPSLGNNVNMRTPSHSSDPVAGFHVCVRSTISELSIYPLDSLLRFGQLVFNYSIANSSSSCPDSTANLYITTAQEYIGLTAQERVHRTLQTDGLVLAGDALCACPVSVCSKALAQQFSSNSPAVAEFYSLHPKIRRPLFLGLGPRLNFKVPVHVSLASDRTQLVSVNGSNMMSSKFVLCEPALESHCIYEACASGSLPVVILDDAYRRYPCVDPLAPLLDSGAPFVQLSSKDNLEAVLAHYLPHVNQLQTRLLDWHQKFWAKTSREFECALLERLQFRLPQLAASVPEINCNDDALEFQVSFEPLLPPPVVLMPSAAPSPYISSDQEKEGNSNDSAESAEEASGSIALRNHNSNRVPLITGCGRYLCFPLLPKCSEKNGRLLVYICCCYCSACFE